MFTRSLGATDPSFVIAESSFPLVFGVVPGPHISPRGWPRGALDRPGGVSPLDDEPEHKPGTYGGPQPFLPNHQLERGPRIQLAEPLEDGRLAGPRLGRGILGLVHASVGGVERGVVLRR